MSEGQGYISRYDSKNMENFSSLAKTINKNVTITDALYDAVVDDVYDNNIRDEEYASADEVVKEYVLNDDIFNDVSNDIADDGDYNDDDSYSDVDDDLEISEISCLSLNVCGLRKRTHYPEFIDLLEQYDIIALQETKTDCFDDIKIYGFKVFLKHRKKCLRKSGGIGIAFKENYEKYITILDDDNSSNYIMWIKLSKELFTVDQDMYMGIVYLPPEGSKYVNDEAFIELEHSILHYSSLSDYVHIVGDFNARTSNRSDYVVIDEHIVEEVDMDLVTMNCEMNPEIILDPLNLPYV